MMRGELRLLVMCMGLVAFSRITQGEEYVLVFVKSSSYERIQAVAGETGCRVKVRHGSERIVLSYSTRIIYLSDSELATSGIEQKSVTVTVIGKDVTIYGEYVYSTFNPLPISALGMKYIVSSCHPPNDHSDYTSVLVIATHSLNTDVDITFRLEGRLTYQNKTYSDGDILTLSLEEYQTFTIISDFDLTGTVVNSVHTVAVFSGTLYSDHIVAYDQLLPVQHYGQEYVVAVDDNPALYQLQIVSEHSDTQLSFNNGSTILVGESALHRQTLSKNSSLQFSSNRPVMTTLCRGNSNSSGFLVIPPMALHTKQTTLAYTRFKVLTVDEADMNVRNSSISNIPGQWEKIPGTGYKVGTWRDRSSVNDISSNTSFVIISFDVSSIYNGGYKYETSLSSLDNTTSADYTATSTCITSTHSNSSRINSNSIRSNSSNNNNRLTIVSAVCGVIIFLLLIIIVMLVIYMKATRPPKSETTSNRVISNVTHTDLTNAHYENSVPNDQDMVFQQQDDQQVSRDTGNTYSDLSLYENSGDANQYEKLHVYGN